MVGRRKVHTSSAEQHALVIYSFRWANISVAPWGLKLRFSKASNYEEASASGCWPDQTWEVQVSLCWVSSRKYCEKLHFVFVLLLVFVSQSSSLYWVTFRRYCETLHHWEPSIYQSLTTTFFQRMLFLQFIIVRRYITGNPPSQEEFISHWLSYTLNGCFSSNFLNLIIYQDG